MYNKELGMRMRNLNFIMQNLFIKPLSSLLSSPTDLKEMRLL
jgi:hypothetical protein